MENNSLNVSALSGRVVLTLFKFLHLSLNFFDCFKFDDFLFFNFKWPNCFLTFFVFVFFCDKKHCVGGQLCRAPLHPVSLSQQHTHRHKHTHHLSRAINELFLIWNVQCCLRRRIFVKRPDHFGEPVLYHFVFESFLLNLLVWTCLSNGRNHFNQSRHLFGSNLSLTRIRTRPKLDLWANHHLILFWLFSKKLSCWLDRTNLDIRKIVVYDFVGPLPLTPSPTSFNLCHSYSYSNGNFISSRKSLLAPFYLRFFANCRH